MKILVTWTGGCCYLSDFSKAIELYKSKPNARFLHWERQFPLDQSNDRMVWRLVKDPTTLLDND